jgi:hypothetical protein
MTDANDKLKYVKEIYEKYHAVIGVPEGARGPQADDEEVDSSKV